MIEDRPVPVDNEGFRQAVDTKLDADIAIEVLADGAVRIAKLIKKAAGISIIVTIIDADDRQASGKAVDGRGFKLAGRTP